MGHFPQNERTLAYVYAAPMRPHQPLMCLRVPLSRVSLSLSLSLSLSRSLARAHAPFLSLVYTVFKTVGVCPCGPPCGLRS